MRLLILVSLDDESEESRLMLRLSAMFPQMILEHKHLSAFVAFVVKADPFHMLRFDQHLNIVILSMVFVVLYLRL